jgi:hypothetical protein
MIGSENLGPGNEPSRRRTRIVAPRDFIEQLQAQHPADGHGQRKIGTQIGTRRMMTVGYLTGWLPGCPTAYPLILLMIGDR